MTTALLVLNLALSFFGFLLLFLGFYDVYKRLCKIEHFLKIRAEQEFCSEMQRAGKAELAERKKGD